MKNICTNRNKIDEQQEVFEHLSDERSAYQQLTFGDLKRELLQSRIVIAPTQQDNRSALHHSDHVFYPSSKACEIEKNLFNETASYSSQVSERTFQNPLSPFTDECAVNPDFCQFKQVNIITRQNPLIEKELNLKTEKKIYQEMKKEYFSIESNDGLDLIHLDESKKYLDKQKKQIEESNFYQKKIRDITQNFFLYKDSTTISKGIYDYKRVGYKKTTGSNKRMEIEVLNKNLINYDKSLAVSDSFRHLSKNKTRKQFQILIKRKIRCLREDIFSDFVHLSLKKREHGNTPYISWKKLISEKLFDACSVTQKIILKDSKKKDFGKIKGGIYFTENYLNFSKNILIREIMRHSLFSIFIETDQKLKNIFVSRASMSWFLNRYSECFLKELNNHKNEKNFKKMMNSSYSSWKRSKKKSIKKIIDIAQPKFRSLFESDKELIRKNVFVLGNCKFRPLIDDEFQGIISLINHLVNFEGTSGIIDRACRHFHRYEHNEQLPVKNNELLEYKNKISVYPSLAVKKDKNSPAHNDPMSDRKTNIRKRIYEKFPIKKEKIEKKIGSCFNKIAENYRQLMLIALEKCGKIDNSTVSGDIYDYRRIQSIGGLQGIETHGEEIEVLDDHISLLDPLIHERNENFFRICPFSKNPDRKKFQENLRERINGTIKPAIFINFVSTSLSGQDEKNKNSYLFWKGLIINSIYNQSNVIATEIFGHDYQKKKRLNDFINRCSFSFSKSLIREILRCALFSIPIKKGGDQEIFFASRASLSSFLNKYADCFLEELLKYEKIDKKFIKGGNSSYSSWRESKKERIGHIVTSYQEEFEKYLKADCQHIQKEVLVFEKNGFRPMLDDELLSLLDFIYQLIQSKSSGSFVNKAIHHFFREKRVKGKRAFKKTEKVQN